jgi:chemotaxis protein CheC
MEQESLSPDILEKLVPALHQGAADCSVAISEWCSAPLSMAVKRVGQSNLQQATTLLGAGDHAVCACLMNMEGSFSGQMLLGFEDSSGLILADLILGRPRSESTTWTEIEISAAMETMNIAGSAFLNGLASQLSQQTGQSIRLLPTPPVFLRDYAESLLQSAFMNQALLDSLLVYTETRFELRGQPLSWTFLWIPDADSLEQLRLLLC